MRLKSVTRMYVFATYRNRMYVALSYFFYLRKYFYVEEIMKQISRFNCCYIFVVSYTRGLPPSGPPQAALYNLRKKKLSGSEPEPST